MPKRVVDAFELVEVQAKYGYALSPFDPFELVFEPLAQQYAIGQIGQCVVTGHMCDTYFRTLAFGNVFVRGNPSAARQGVVQDGKGATIAQLEYIA